MPTGFKSSSSSLSHWPLAVISAPMRAHRKTDGIVQLGRLIFVMCVALELCRPQCSSIIILANAANSSQSSAHIWPTTDWPDPMSPIALDDSQSGACDLLFSRSDNLANYCQCKDGSKESLESATGSNQPPLKGGTDEHNINMTSAAAAMRLVHISQLACLPQNFTQIRQDLAKLVAPTPPSKQAAIVVVQFQLDYLSIGTNLSCGTGEAPIYHEPGSWLQGELARTSPHHQPLSSSKLNLLIDHISLQLTATLANVKDGDGCRSMEEQMIDFVRLINETHLQFLSIFIEHSNNNSSNQQATEFAAKRSTIEANNDSAVGEIKLDRLLARLPALTRLELSLEDAKSELLMSINWESLQQQTRLKWLNLASNKRLKLSGTQVKTINGKNNDDNSGNNNNNNSFFIGEHHKSPFQWTPNIEYLSLESCNLKSFPLFSIFSIPFKFTTKPSNNQQQQQQFESTTFYGMPNLNSLSLAGNKLVSFERDLFASSNNHGDEFSAQTSTICQNSKLKRDRHSRVFLLPLLAQLDLSYNKLSDLTFKVGQLILCTMPSLNQLYLQRNKIIQLNLNSLLSFPFEWPKSIHDNTTEDSGWQATLMHDKANLVQRYSRLEYIDLSHNLLNRITGLQEWRASSSSFQIRIKSINLSHNRLRSTIDYIDFSLINRVVFEESFNTDELINNRSINMNSLDDLEASFINLSENKSNTLCDFLSPENNSNNGELLNEIILSNNALERITKKDFYSNQCEDIQILRIANNRIVFIEEDSLFTLTKLEQIDLSSNHLENLMENTFSKNIKLKVLNLSKNNIKHLNQTILSYLTDLEEILIDNNGLTELQTELFANNNRLNIIDLSKNKLFKLEPAIFANLKQLRILNLHGNLLRQFSFNLFKSLQSVIASSDNVQLLLSKQLTSFNPSINQSKLKKSKTSKSSQLKSAKKKRTRRSIEELNSLKLSSNQINLLQLEHCLQYSQSIQILELDDNKLESLTSTSLNCFRSTRSLFLQSNNIRSIEEMTFSNMSELEYLDLSQNQLAFIQPRTFSFSSVLHHINLSNNKLSNLKLMDVFKLTGTKSDDALIESLNLNNNPNLSLDTADLLDFIFRSSIRELKLGNIERIQQTRHRNQTAHQSRIYLETLNLSSIYLVDEQFIKVMSETTVEIEKLIVSHTNASSDKGSFIIRSLVEKQLQSSVIELDLAGNQLDDQQFTILIKDLKVKSRLIKLNLASNMIETWPIRADKAALLSTLTNLDISNNKMHYFIRKEPASYRLPELQVLNLSSNALIGLIEHVSDGRTVLSNLMPRLRWLDLSNNRLTWIPAQFFKNFNELSWLRLDHNQLEVFPGITSNRRLVVDLKFNQRLSTLLTDESGSNFEQLDDDDLVLFNLRSNIADPLECNSIENYVNNYNKESPLTRNDELLEDLEESRTDSERCATLIKAIDTFTLKSMQATTSLNITNGSRYIHLSLHRSGMIDSEVFSRNRDIMVLDLYDNRIQDLQTKSCDHFSVLKTIDLGRNLLKTLPSNLIISCRKLTYLDLSFNKISSINKIDTSTFRTSSIQVLKLNNNQLRELSNLNIDTFRSLRLIELSSNQFKADNFLPSLRNSIWNTVIIDIEPWKIVHTNAPKLRVTNDSLIFHSPTEKSLGNKYLLSMMQNGSNDTYTTIINENFDHVIKYCAINFRGLIQVCIKIEVGYTRCFQLKIPYHTSSCLTNLERVIDNSKSENGSPLISVAEENIEEDSVLQFISYLKRNWLKLKELNVNEYLTSISNISVDSVLFNYNGNYPIKTLMLMKWAMFLSAMCIIGLLIAMFALLTRQDSSQNVRNTSKFMNINDESDGSLSVINKTSSCTSSDSSAAQASLLPTVSSSIDTTESRTSKDDTQQQTVVENNMGRHLDANQLLQQQQACSTPSSSIAPSSIETAETMQAVDSIKSGFSIIYSDSMNKDSVDQYADKDRNFPQQQQSQQVATVMRMIKSNSANFDPSGNRSKSNQLYGTTDTRYSTLRSKISAIHEHHQQRRQIYPVQVPQQQPIILYEGHDECSSGTNQVASLTYLNTENINDGLIGHSINCQSDQTISQDQDPTTMSLISINTALSNCFRSSASQQVSPNLYNTGQEQASRLCQYHRFVCDPSPSAIADQERQGNDSRKVSGIPPPPPIRTLKVLEEPVQYIIGSTNCYKDQT